MPNISRQTILRNAVLGFMRVHVLHHCAEQQVCGLDMTEELRRHGFRVSPGTLYPMLNAMEDAGFLRSVRVIVGGRSRRYYRATRAGEVLLDELRGRVRELVEEILETRSPRGKSRRARSPRA